MIRARTLLLPLTLALAPLALSLAPGCSDGCKVAGDCAKGQLCDFVTGDCIDGCKRDEDCNQGYCDTQYGVCRARSHPTTGRDAATSTTSASDASAGD